jgi:ribosome maturation factor RimP
MRLTKHPVVERIEAEVDRTLASFGYELVQIKFGGPSHHPTLTVLMDKPGGVTSGDCQYMTERLSVLLDVLDPVPSRYSLVVSSPGINRPLVKDEDFVRFAGQRAAVTYRDAADKRITVRGLLEGVTDEQVTLVVGEERQVLPLAQIEQARLDFDWGDNAD